MSINRNQVTGRTTELKGKIRELAGKIIGNRRMQVRGRVQTIIGQGTAAAGDLVHRMDASSRKRI